VLGIAAAIKALPQPPRRSTLILLVAAEEQGLIGSKYYGEHPSFPPGRIAADINFDSANIWGKTRRDLHRPRQVARRRREARGRLSAPGGQDDRFPDRGHYRSDQFGLARVGVPALYLNQAWLSSASRKAGAGRGRRNTPRRYHQPSDQYDASWTDLVQDAQLGFWCGLIVATPTDADTERRRRIPKPPASSLAGVVTTGRDRRDSTARRRILHERHGMSGGGCGGAVSCRTVGTQDVFRRSRLRTSSSGAPARDRSPAASAREIA
jgi:hypothetical protein